MSPQDPQDPQTAPVVDPNAAVPVQPAADLSAQIPPSYAPSTPADSVAPVVASPLDEALNAALTTPEPDPMAGFSDPAVQAASATPQIVDPVAQSDPVVAPVMAEVATETAPIAPAPSATQAYDPSQDAGVGAPASSYPSAPEPLPPNPLEIDSATAPAAPFAPEEPIAAPAVEAAMPQPAPVEVAPLEMPPAEQPYVDTASVAPAVDAVSAAGGAPATDPTLQSMLDNPQGAVAGDDSYIDPTVLAASSSSSSGGGKGILMSIGIGVVVLVLGVGVLALVLGKKPTTDLPADSLTSQDGSPASTTIQDISVPEGYIAVNKECYQFGIPTDNTISADDKSCKIDATFGKQATSTITVLPGTDSFDSLDKAVAATKTSASLTASNIVSERKITLGGFDAQEIVHNVGTTTPKNSTMIVVLLKDGKYKLDGKAITTFQIDMDSSDAFTSDAVKTLESSWSWN